MSAIVSYGSEGYGKRSVFYEYDADAREALAEIASGADTVVFQWLNNDRLAEYQQLLDDVLNDEYMTPYERAVDNWLWYGQLLEEYLHDCVTREYRPCLTKLNEIVYFMNGNVG